jgi:signal recognition particle receptor subunit alpha
VVSILWNILEGQRTGYSRKIVTLTYVDKLIDDVHQLFRDMYGIEIQQQSALSLLNGTIDFKNDFLRLLW